MSELNWSSDSTLAQALGRIPSGLYILTVRDGERATGMLASWVQQAGFEPPMVTVAIGMQRYVGDWVAKAGRFTLNQLAEGSKPLIRHFGRGFEADAPAFEGLALSEVEGFGPIIKGAIAYLDVEVAGEIGGGDHRIFLGRVINGVYLDGEREPLVHVRHNGFHY